MKKIAIATILAAGFIGSAMATNLGISAAEVNGSAVAVSGSGAYATSNGNGGSYSSASNATRASVGVDAYDYAGYQHRTGFVGGAGVAGEVSTHSESAAKNVSYGNGTGVAAAGGYAKAEAEGSGGYIAPGVAGVVGGSAESTTANGVIAGRNGKGYVHAGTEAGFRAEAESVAGRSSSADTSATAYSNSHKFGGTVGNASSVNFTKGEAAAGALAIGGNHVSAD